jgi:hypothetical protein
MVVIPRAYHRGLTSQSEAGMSKMVQRLRSEAPDGSEGIGCSTAPFGCSGMCKVLLSSA